MHGPIFYLAIVVMIAVAVVLLLGLRNMMRNGPGNLSNKLMRARVMLQFAAVVLIVIGIFVMKQNGQG